MRALLAAVLALAAPPQASGPQTRPETREERGLWAQMDEEERQIARSALVVRDAGLNRYVREVLCRTVGPRCAEVRLYILRTPYLNASMAPNGTMVLFTGTFLRTRDEAQLAAVLGHEFTHYSGRHSLRLFRDARTKTSTYAFLGVPLAILTGGIGNMVAGAAVAHSLTGFSREMEREADAGSVTLLKAAGYDPAAAAGVWRQVRAERDATAAMRRRKPRGEDAIFGSHPTTAERMATLAALATAAGTGGDDGRARYRAALAPYWAGFIDDQIKLNDFGATMLLLEAAAHDGWTGPLLYARGELYRSRGLPADLADAVRDHRAALAAGGAPAEARRGLGLALLRKGEVAEGRAALAAYLAGVPDAADREMLEALAAP